MDLNKILVVIEADAEQQPALDKARQLAGYGKCELELMLADFNAYLEDGYYFDPVQAQKLRYEHGEQRLQELEKLAQPLREEGLQVSVATAWGNPPYEEVIRRIQEVQPSLVIKATRHHSKLSRMLLSNDDWELVRYCPVPLLLTKEQAWQQQPVLIASVDPDHIHDKPAALDHKIISTAQALASLSAGSVHLFHSAWLPPLSGIYPLVADAREEEDKLRALAEQNQVDASHCHWSGKDIGHALPELVAELSADVVIMGAVSRSRLDRAMIGSTAEKVMDHLDCDVLVVKPDHMPAMSQVLV